jgi:hypothetical protein
MPHKRHHKSKKTRRGGFYSFNGQVAPGAANWTRGAEVPTNDVGGAPIPVNLKGGRKRSHKKKSTRRRKMRGGYSFGQSVAGFTGQGTSRGMGGYSDVSQPGGKAALGEFANHGAQPGGNWGNYKLHNY